MRCYYFLIRKEEEGVEADLGMQLAAKLSTLNLLRFKFMCLHTMRSKISCRPVLVFV